MKSSRARDGRVRPQVPSPTPSLRLRVVRSVGPVLVLAALALVYGIYLRVSLASLDREAAGAWTTLQTLLKERGDLALEFVAVARDLARKEQTSAHDADADADANAPEKNAGEPTVDQVLDVVAKTSERLRDAPTPTLGANAEVALGAALGNLFYAVKDMPALRADENYQRLLNELAKSESAITDARSRYNGIVMKENASIVKFPGKLVAPLVKLDPREYFNAIGDGDAQTNPVLQFDAAPTTK